MKRKAPRPTFDTPSHTIVIEPVKELFEPVEPVEAVVPGQSPTVPPEHDDDTRTTSA
jgi:hypothetical protein